MQRDPNFILHSDLNSFYASVEVMLNPQLKDKALAVCGATEDRHGIVLAKSEMAKKAGVKTGMVNWEAKQKCPDLIMVKPNYDQYLKYSKLTREIYLRFTDKVEPYGMDECWLDVSATQKLYGRGQDIAEIIRNTVKEELGLTVSIGVSFNKIFAKLGSDLKKPDAISLITKENYRNKVWPLPAGDLFYVGRATQGKLQRLGIYTIGDLANTPMEVIKNYLGKNGEMLWYFANGLDQSAVMPTGHQNLVKSIGHGTTCRADLDQLEDVWCVLQHLTQDIGHRLRLHELRTKGIQLTVKDKSLGYRQYQMPLLMATQSPLEIALAAKGLFEKHYDWAEPVRALTVRAINLEPLETPQQLLLLDDTARRIKQEQADNVVEALRERFGKWSVYPASLLGSFRYTDGGQHEVIMPGMMHT